jgi:uncharacterized membrane protein YgcG
MFDVPLPPTGLHWHTVLMKDLVEVLLSLAWLEGSTTILLKIVHVLMLKGFHHDPGATKDQTAQPVVPDHRLVVFWNALTSNHRRAMPSSPSSASSSSTTSTSSTSFFNDCSHIQTFTNDLLQKSWMVLRPRNALPEKNNVPNKKTISNQPEIVLQQQEDAVEDPGGEQKFETMAMEEKESTSDSNNNSSTGETVPPTSSWNDKDTASLVSNGDYLWLHTSELGLIKISTGHKSRIATACSMPQPWTSDSDDITTTSTTKNTTTEVVGQEDVDGIEKDDGGGGCGDGGDGGGGGDGGDGSDGGDGGDGGNEIDGDYGSNGVRGGLMVWERFFDFVLKEDRRRGCGARPMPLCVVR